MKFDATDRVAMLDALGETIAVLDGSSHTFTAMFYEPGAIIEHSEGAIIVSDPTIIADQDEVGILQIKGGAAGSDLAIDGNNYTVLSVLPNGDGFTTITLEKLT